MDGCFSGYRRFQYGSSGFVLLLAFLLSACSTGSAGTHPQKLPCITSPSNSGSSPGALEPLATIPLPGQPFKSVVTRDGLWIFVSLDSSHAASNGIAVLRRDGAQICLLRIIPLPAAPLGLALTKDDGLLLVADYASVVFLDVGRAQVGTVQEKSDSIAIEVVLSSNDQYAFVANENYGTLGVIDVQRIRRHGFSATALIGQVQVNQGPIGYDSGPVGMAISPNNRYLYVTSRIDTGDPSNQGRECYGFPKGSLSVVDIARAGRDPSHAVVAYTFAGCGPVRVMLSSSGNIAWVTVQESNMLLTFSTSRLTTNPHHALLASISVGMAPTGMAHVENDAVIVITNSNRFAEPQTPQTLTLLDTKQALAGRTVILGTINVGAFPRELTLSSNGQSLFLTNYNSRVSPLQITVLPFVFILMVWP